MLKNELQKIIGTNLLRIRTERQYTREQLAEKVGLSVTFYANLESGKKMMSVVTLRKLADELGVTTDSLLYEDCPCSSSEQIEACLRNAPQQTVEFAEKIVRLCVEEMPCSTLQKRGL